MGGEDEQAATEPTGTPRFARPADVGELDYASHLGDPGEFPFTRGHLGGSSRRGWIHRELSGEGSPRTSNVQLLRLIEHGAAGLDVIGDAPTVGLMDPDHPYARHSVGTQGVSLCRVDDFEQLYEGVPLESISVSHSLPATFTVAALHLVATRRGLDPALIRGSVINAPMFMEDYAYATHLPYEARMRMALDAIEFAADHMPKFHAFVEDTYFISDGGIGPVDEMALGFIEIREVVRRLIERGVAVDRFAPRIAILVNCRMDLLTEIAKVRATRRIFAQMMRDEFGAIDPRSWSANITVHTSGASLTAQQPVNNVIRGALQALAMSFAGVKAMEVSAFDEAYRTPSDAAHEVALRTQQIVALETDAAEVIDVFGGSYEMERRTNEIERAILDRVHEIEGKGPIGDLVDGGFFRSLFQSAMIETGRAITDGTRPVVGVNCHVVPTERDTMLREHTDAKVPPATDHIDAIREWKATRDRSAIARVVDEVSRAAANPAASLMSAVVAAMDRDATIGEITAGIRVGIGMAADPLLLRGGAT